jgi:hypothetical protein
MDTNNPGAANDVDKNSRLVKMMGFMQHSRELDMCGRIHCDIFLQGRAMLSEVKVKLVLTPSKPDFCLMGVGAGAFKVKILNVVVHVCKIKISLSTYNGIAKALETANAKYPIICVNCKATTVPQNLSSISINNLYMGQLPKRMICALTDNQGVIGDITKNPFNFHHYNVSDLTVLIDGKECGIKLFKLNYGTRQYIMAYEVFSTDSVK